MAWYDEAIFYHIYPLGLLGAPKQNSYGEPVHRLRELKPWISHVKEIGCNAIYIGPLFESVGHGYETTDYKKLDSRLGTNEDLAAFVANCHAQDIRVIFDGVFNHTGRDFFAFQDILKNRENSAYRDWYCNVNFFGNNEYNDGFSYDNWGGYNLMAKLNQKNPAVVSYICDVIRFWVSEFDVDGIRLDAADVLDFDFMKALRGVANEVKPDFWLMGEVIHGDYGRWVNEGTLHSVTNYQLHKALYSGHNDHNYFEIAHTIRHLNEMGSNRPYGLKLYNFVDNHDVERIYTKLVNKAHFTPVHILLYTLPGVPSIYYGSEFGIEGKKERWSDDSLRPALALSDYADAVKKNPYTALVAALGKTRQSYPVLSYGSYRELLLTNRQFVFARELFWQNVIVTVNNDDNDAVLTVAAPADCGVYVGALGGACATVLDGKLTVTVGANSGEIWVPEGDGSTESSDHAMGGDGSTESPGHAMGGGGGTECSSRAMDSGNVYAGQATENAPKSGAGMCPENGKETLDDMISGEQGVADMAGGEHEKTSVLDALAKESSARAAEKKREEPEKPPVAVPTDKPYEEMTVEELQAAILGKMAHNGPVTEEMKRTVYENVWHDSLVNWVKSFR